MEEYDDGYRRVGLHDRGTAANAEWQAEMAPLGPHADAVDYEVADLFAWRPEREWDACVCGFFLCHVPDERMAGFLDAVAASVRAGGVVCFVDKAVPGEATPDVVERTIGDGRRFTILDRPRPPEEWVARFAEAGMRLAVETIGSRFCLGHGTRV